jgi:hypothetical protein
MPRLSFAFPLLFAGVLWSLATPLPAQDDGIFWFNNYDEAVAETKRSGKPMFLEYRCEP